MTWNPKRWTLNLLIALDQFGNALLGGAPDETISARSARGARDGHRFGRFMCWWLDKLDPGHCADSIKSEAERSHLPEEYRE